MFLEKRERVCACVSGHFFMQPNLENFQPSTTYVYSAIDLMDVPWAIYLLYSKEGRLRQSLEIECVPLSLWWSEG